MKTIIANIVRGGGKTTGFLLAALFAFAFAGAEPAQADEIVDLGGGEPISASASDFSAYKDKIIQHGTINLSESPEKVSVGKYTIGSGATVNFAAGPGFNGNWDWNIVDGGSLNQTKTSEGRMLLPFYYGNCKFTMDNGTFTSQDPGGNSNYAETLNFGVIWANDSKVKDQDISVKVVVRNGSTISLPNGSLRVAGGRKSSNVKVNTLKVDFAITNSTITMAKELQLGSAQSTSTWITDSASSYVNAIFGPGSDITAKQIYAQANPMPSVTFDGATLRWVQGGNSFIGHTSSIGDIYTIDAGGLTVDIPSGKSLSCDQNASSLKGEGGITKIGAGSITWNKVSSNGSQGMTFTGPLVVSNGTWSSSLSYAASAFKANGGTLALSGALSAANVALEATDGGTLTLASATLTDAAPDLTLASGGTTDFFTRDGAATTHTIGTLTLGESATLTLTGGGLGVDEVSVDTLVLSATTANKVALNFSDAANIAPGTYTNLTIIGGATFAAGDEAKFALDANAPEGSTLSVSGASLVLTVPASNPATWTGGANDGKFSSPGNWLGNAVPGASDDVVISVATETTLDCDVPLNVNSITFPATSAKVTIEGTGCITNAAAIVNYSSSRHVIDVPVEFVAAGEYAPIDVTGEVDFQGGVTGTLPANHSTFYGNYTWTATSWTLSSAITLAANATVTASGMTLTLDGDQLLKAEAGSRFSLTKISYTRNGKLFGDYLGEIQVGTLNIMRNATKGVNVNSDFGGILRVDAVRAFVRSDSSTWNIGGVAVIGNTGFRSAGGGFYFGSAGANLVLHSSSNWSIENDYNNSPHNGYYTKGFKINAPSLDIDTSDYDTPSIGRTVTIKRGSTKDNQETTTLLNGDNGASAVSAFGVGTFVFNNTCYFTGGFTASNSVTVAVKKDVNPGRGNVTFNDTATFDLVDSGSGAVPVTGTLTMAGGTTLRVPTFTAGVLPLSVNALAFEGVTSESKVALNIEGGALVEGYNAIIQSATAVSADAWDNFDVTLNATVPAGMTPLYIAQGGTLYIVLKGANDAIWTGGGENANFSTGANWLGGEVPANGSCVFIAAAGDATLACDIQGFSPASITFPAGSAAVTINGTEAITGVTAITNLSSASHTINVPVYFAGDIQVKQAAMAEEGDLNKAHVTFAGGAHAAQGCAIENGNTSAVYSRCMFGDYYLYPASDNPWSALYQGSSKRPILGDNSALHVPYAGALHELYIGNGSVVTASVVNLTSNQRLSFRNYGEYVITTGMTIAGSDKKDGFAGYGSGTGAGNVFKIEKATCTKTDGYTFYFADSNGASHGTYYIGAGGINFGSGNGYFGIGNKDGDLQTIRPWYGDFTIGTTSGNDSKGYDIYMNRDITFNTDDENGVGRTITVDARFKFQNTPTFTVAGSGKVLINSASTANAAQPPVTVTGTATLAMKPGASLTTSNITVNAGATLQVAESGTVSVSNLVLVSGATLSFNFTERRIEPVLDVAALDNENTDPNGTIQVFVSGKRPTGGKHVLTSGGLFGERNIVFAQGGQPDWAKEIDKDEDGNIILEVKPKATMIIIR